MRRFVFIALGALELSAAGVLIYLASALPSTAEVGMGFDRVEDSTRKASSQVGMVRREVGAVRRPEVQRLAERLRLQTELVSRSVKSQHVNFETVTTLRNSLRDVSRGLEMISDTVSPAQLQKLSLALGQTAKYLDERLLPASAKAADDFDRLAADLSRSAEGLAKLLREAPVDLRTAREIRDGLAKFDEGLEKTCQLIDVKRLEAIRDGFSGMETSLETTAGEVEKLAGYKYPHVKIRGLKVDVEEQPFWTKGERVAEGLRKATEGVRAANKEMEDVAREMPAIRAALDESRKVVGRTRSALDQVLKQQDLLDPLLRDIPARTAKLAQDLPKLTQDLAKVLHETSHLREIAEALKQTQSALDATSKNWPEFRSGIKQSAKLLQTSADQLDRVVANRDDYESSVRQSTELADTFAEMVPLITEQLSAQLGEQEKSLLELESSLDDMGSTVPTYKRGAIEMLQVSHWLIWLATAALGLHGTMLVVENVRRTKRVDVA